MDDHRRTEELMKLNREFGSLEARIAGLERRVDERMDAQKRELEDLKNAHKESNGKLDELLMLVQAGKASWKTAVGIAAGASSLTLAVAWIVERIPVA